MALFDGAWVHLMVPQQCLGNMVTADRVTCYTSYHVVQRNTSTQHIRPRVHDYFLTSLLHPCWFAAFNDTSNHRQL